MNAITPIHADTALLVIYERMCAAIAECVAVDEAKDIRDKALALEAYYRQARNLEAEREAANVRLRAERRVGELLKELARAEVPNPAGRKGKEITPERGGNSPSPYASALQAQGISSQAASRFQALADMPQKDFDLALSGPSKPTTAGVLKARQQVRDPAPKTRVSDSALWLWGRLRDFERNGYFDADPQVLRRSMTDAMHADVLRLIPHVRDFLTAYEEQNESA